MKATLEKREKNRVTLLIEVDELQLAGALEAAYRTVVKKVNVPGFRKGHVPRPMLERFLGPGALLQEALEKLVPDVYAQAVEETGIEPIDHPEIDIVDFPDNKPLKLKAEVDVKPEVILHEYKGLAVERTLERVDDTSVDHALYHLRENQAELVTAEHTSVTQGDFVTIDFTGFVDGKPFPGGAASNYELEIGSGRFINGFEEQLVGAMVDEERELHVTFPLDYGNGDLAGKDAAFQVKVHEIKERRFPEINDEFAKDVSDFNTLIELREDIKGNLEKQATEKAEGEMRSTLIREAAQRAEVEVPTVMVDREVEAMISDFARTLAYRGMELERYLQASGGSIDTLRSEYRNEAEERVKSRLVLEAIADKEGINPTADEVQAQIDEIATGAGNRADEVRARYEEPERRKMVEENMRLEKAVDLLAASAQVTTKEVEAPVEPGHEGHQLSGSESVEDKTTED